LLSTAPPPPQSLGAGTRPLVSPVTPGRSSSQFAPFLIYFGRRRKKSPGPSNFCSQSSLSFLY
jgi:hypothetical protein